ncbi:type II secretion system protein GspL [Ramlibacter sp. PS4R-6]|uniref:type II secretion system protein GspL n=1 Tax=Ramlibacter sp. PS4R-6 TaxID=3133438 RepID=UPI0030AD3437
MSALVVVLPPAPGSEFAYVVTNDGVHAARHGSAQAQLLPLPAQAGSEIVAVVPIAKLSWHRVDLPKGVGPRSPRLRAVLEGLLEERLLDEPETLHFALQPQARAESAAWVATCEREWLRDALQALENAGRPVTRIVPEFAPQAQPALYAIGDPDDAVLVAVTPDGVTPLPLASAALALLPSLPADTALVSEPAVAALAEQVLQHPPVLQQSPERWVRAAQSDWDLAQFDLSSSGGARTLKKAGALWADVVASPQWRPARWGALVLIVLNLVALNAFAWRERSAIEGKREAMRRSLTQAFPEVKVVVDAPVQMEREVAALRQATGAVSGRDLEAMLAALAASLPPQRALGALDYANGELRVRGLGLGPEEARNVAAAMRSRGYNTAVTGDLLVVTPEAGA